MDVRVFLARAVERDLREVSQPEAIGVEGLLPGEDDAWREPARGKRVGDRRQFDGFRPGANDQPDVGETQPSPLLGGVNLPPLQSEFKRLWRGNS
jgi:hypothetical protein